MTKNDYVFRYRVRNWHDYNRALVSRGRLTFWFDEDAIAGWRSTELRSRPGTPRVYSDAAIQCALGRCCTIRPRRDLGRIPNSPSRHHGVGLWPAKFDHPVEDVTPDRGLSPLRVAVPRLQAASEH